MERELLPAVSLLPETLSVLIAPEEMLARGLNGNPHLQQYRTLFIAIIRSGIYLALKLFAVLIKRSKTIAPTKGAITKATKSEDGAMRIMP